VSTDTPKGHQILQGIAARALDDPDYRKQLVADPKPILKKEGLTVADDVEVVVHENEHKRVHLVLPSRPKPDQQLDVNETNVRPLADGLHF
jgi:Nitrile hydratase, alpha chain